MRKLKQFDRVLVRANDKDSWGISLFFFQYPNPIDGYGCIDGDWSQCIPYEGNEHLLKTKDAPKEDSMETKWRPSYCELYYFIDKDGKTHSSTWVGDKFDDCLAKFGNYFKTEKEAKEMADKIKKLLKTK